MDCAWCYIHLDLITKMLHLPNINFSVSIIWKFNIGSECFTGDIWMNERFGLSAKLILNVNYSENYA